MKFSVFVQPLIVISLLGLVLLSCSQPEGEMALLELVPEFDQDCAHHIFHDSESEFRDYCEEMGATFLLERSYQLHSAISDSTVAEYVRTEEIVYLPLLRIRTQLSELYFLKSEISSLEFFHALPPEEAILLLRQVSRMHMDFISTELTDEEKYERLQESLQVFTAHNMTVAEVVTESQICRVLGNLGRREESKALIQRNLHHAQQAGMRGMECQIWGNLAMNFPRGSDPDSLQICLDEGLAVAMMCRLPQASVRLLSFKSINYFNNHQDGLALEYFDLGRQLCREYKIGLFEIYFIRQYLLCFAERSTNEHVREHLERANFLLNQMEDGGREFDISFNRMYVDQIEAYCLMVDGKPAQAAEIFARIVSDPDNRINHAGEVIDAYDRWVTGLRNNHLDERALSVLVDAIGFCAETAYLRDGLRNKIIKAELTCNAGRLQEAQEILDDLMAAYPEEIMGDADIAGQFHLRQAEVFLASGERELALAAMRKVVSLFEEIFWGQPNISSGYLFDPEQRGIREGLHMLCVDDPEESYALEMAWRGLMRKSVAMKNSPSRNEEGTNLIAAAEMPVVNPGSDPGHSRILRNWLNQTGSRHLVYLSASDRLVCWYADGATVVRHEFPISKKTLETKIKELQQDLVDDAEVDSGSLSPDLKARLSEWARMLLPPDLLNLGSDDTAPSTLLISGDGVLSDFPFGILNLGDTTDYRPLLVDYSPAVLHSMRTPGQRTINTSELIVGAPDISPALKRRFPSLVNSVGAVEAHIAAELFPSSELLEGRDAFKSAIKARWGDVAILYIAGHLMRDPNLPIRTILPLAEDPNDSSQLQDRILIADVLETDFSGCGLVVLSGCDSGSRHVAGQFEAPSLAEGFMNAGAGSVVYTSWPVRDSQASNLMSRFCDTLVLKDRNALESLIGAQRMMLEEDGDHSHPAVWGAYSIMLGDLSGYP
ncbi:MAG: CHAT domain-containing protein [bacterium]|nr:CHAT domain-containing protein [bacterium]